MVMRIPYYPSREFRIKKLLEIFEPPSGSKIIDLGSGDGRVLREFARRYDDVLLYGIEKDPILINISKKLSEEFNNITINRGDLFKEDLSNYNIVYTYLTTEALERLRDKAINFIKKGGVWIALDYRIPRIKPVLVIELDKWHKYYIYGDERKVKFNF